MISTITTIYDYSFIPSLILVGLGVLIFLAWVFGTDVYDNMEDMFDDSEFNSFLGFHLVCSVLSTIIWLVFKDVFIIWLLACVFNTWLSFCMLLAVILITGQIMSSVREYCLIKRGKKHD
jgi:hypothetical protein